MTSACDRSDLSDPFNRPVTMKIKTRSARSGVSVVFGGGVVG
jgi:hypothetical protein